MSIIILLSILTYFIYKYVKDNEVKTKEKIENVVKMPVFTANIDFKDMVRIEEDNIKNVVKMSVAHGISKNILDIKKTSNKIINKELIETLKILLQIGQTRGVEISKVIKEESYNLENKELYFVLTGENKESLKLYAFIEEDTK